jgi:hypothetical protein
LRNSGRGVFKNDLYIGEGLSLGVLLADFAEFFFSCLGFGGKGAKQEGEEKELLFHLRWF